MRELFQNTKKYVPYTVRIEQNRSAETGEKIKFTTLTSHAPQSAAHSSPRGSLCCSWSQQKPTPPHQLDQLLTLRG